MSWHHSVKLVLVWSVVALAVIGLACGKAQPAAAPAKTPTATAQDKAAMEPKAMVEAKAMEEKAAMEAKAMAEKLPDQQFAAHFVNSTPNHRATFAQMPDKVVINFDFTLSETSTITVSKDGAPVVSAKPTFSGNKLTMSAPLPANVGNGLYQVDYKACWPDQSCHTGKFAFTVGS
jgi:methionine-rich copper-binding protein CopC